MLCSVDGHICYDTPVCLFMFVSSFATMAAGLSRVRFLHVCQNTQGGVKLGFGPNESEQIVIAD